MALRRSRSRIKAALAAVVGGLLLFGSATASDLRILEPSDQIEIVHREDFAATEAFRIGGRIGERTLANIGFNFERHFLSTVQPRVPAALIQTWTLRNSADDAALIKAMRGERALPLSAVHRLMRRGGDTNLTDGRSNFAYVRAPDDGRLWAIHWLVNERDEWVVGAVQVPHPDMLWHRGSRFFALAVKEARAPERD